jgi:hypothetical protein
MAGIRLPTSKKPASDDRTRRRWRVIGERDETRGARRPKSET